GVSAPVGVSLLDQQLALVEQPFQDQVDVELAIVGVTDADGDVLEIDEEGEPLLVLGVQGQRCLLRVSLTTPVTGAHGSREARRGPGRRRYDVSIVTLEK